MKKRDTGSFLIWCIAISVLLPVTDVVAQDANEISLEDAIREVKELYHLRDFEWSIVRAEQHLELYPKSVELKAWRINSMSLNNQREKAIKKAEHLVEAHPDNPWSWYAFANSAGRETSRADEAYAAVEKMFDLGGKTDDFMYMKALVHFNQKSKTEAIKTIDKLIPQVESPARFYSLKASAIYSLSIRPEDTEYRPDFEEALKYYSKAGEIDPELLNSYYLPGVYLSARQRHDESYTLLKQAAKMSAAPDVHVRYWNTISSLNHLTREQKNEKIEKEITALIERRPATAGLFQRISSQYSAMGMADKQKYYEDKVLELFPVSESAEWVLVNRYRAFRNENSGKLNEEKDPEIIAEYRSMLHKFIDRPVHIRESLKGDAYRELFYSVRNDEGTDAEELFDIVMGMVKYEGINYHISHAAGPVALAERGAYFDEGRELVIAGIELVKERLEEYREMGLYQTEEDWQRARNWQLGTMTEALGWIFFNEGNPQKAEKYLMEAYSLNSENRQTLFYLGRLYEALGQPENAESYYVMGLAVEGMGTNPNEAALQDLYVKQRGSLEGYDNYIASIKLTTGAERKEKVLAERISDAEQFPPFTLRNLSGGEFSSDQLEGKIVAINFWGKWCGPCVAEMPEFQELHEKYAGDDQVVILTINNDMDEDDLQKWMEDHEYTFTVLRDDGYLTQSGVNAFPTTWFMDENGYIVYTKIGYTEKLVEEFSWRIEDVRDSEI